MKTYLCDGIKYRPILDDDLTLYQAFLPLLDQEWKNGSLMYVSKGGGNKVKRARIQAILDAEGYLMPPEVYIVPEGLMVVDGRNRIALLRDIGKKEIVISSKSDLTHFKWAKKISEQ